MGADGHHLLQAQTVPGADEGAAVAVEPVGQDDTEAHAQAQQFLDELDGQVRLGRIDVTRI